MRRASAFSPQSSPTILAMTAGKITATCRQVWHLIHRWWPRSAASPTVAAGRPRSSFGMRR